MESFIAILMKIKSYFVTYLNRSDKYWSVSNQLYLRLTECHML